MARGLCLDCCCAGSSRVDLATRDLDVYRINAVFESGVKSIPPNTENYLQYGYDENANKGSDDAYDVSTSLTKPLLGRKNPRVVRTCWSEMIAITTND